MEYSEVTIAGFQLGHLLLAFIIISTFCLVLYYLWTWPCGKNAGVDGSQSRKSNTLLPTLKPLYALELEPGIVVLQSEDGEFFRILREYDSADKTGNGSTSLEHPSSDANNRYLLSYTRAHYQTRPSAPHLDPNNRLDPFDDGATWQPINTISTHHG
ncbi:unnamed protein product [Candidula unifasciata]|uniref:Uncharacterized protein n=1 Tax=Candidula unifasciata TaxID=100452 RepID=A0A8S3YJ74_9EUPU|nr:unnamed protein product [Candidula unifasciata]